MNKTELEVAMLRKRMNVKELSERIGIDPSSYYRKVENNTFTMKEVNKIVQVLDLTESDFLNIFFTKVVA